MPTVVRLVNGKQRRASNPAHLVILGNGKRSASMAKKRRKKAKAGRNPNPNPFFSKKAKGRRRRRRNPNPSMHRRRRNPGESLNDTVVIGLSAAAGGVGTRAIPQAVLPKWNTGLTGYALNLGVAFGGGYLIKRFGNAPRAAFGWKIGGVVAVVGRLLEDYAGKKVIEFGTALQGLGYRGDAAYDFRLRGMGSRYVPSFTPQPTSSVVQNGLMITSQPVAALPPAAAVATAKAGAMKGLGYNPNWGRRSAGGRFAA